MRLVLLVAALILFLLAGISAFADSVNVNEAGFVALGLAAWVGSVLVPERLG